ncbi:MAG: hypothetical protein IH945_04890 [Armatimonadetes bacterium]|nr:hypothetical protein [Armatimonadota bacterium]
MTPRSWLSPVGAALLIGGVLTALSCGGGGQPSAYPSCGLGFASPNYAAAVDPSTNLTNRLRWWSGFPVKVWIDPNSAVLFPLGGANILSTDMILAGIDRWLPATSNGVRITIVASKSDADIEIKMVKKLIPRFTLGVTTAQVFSTSREVVSAQISISWWDGMTLQQVRDGMKATAAHEMGHALYINGHSTDAADLMYYQNNSFFDKVISAADQNTIQTAYCGSFQTRGRGVGDGPIVIERTVCPADPS